MQIVRLKDETQVAAEANKYGLARAGLVMTKDIYFVIAHVAQAPDQGQQFGLA
jgi:hypothetical protein